MKTLSIDSELDLAGNPLGTTATKSPSNCPSDNTATTLISLWRPKRQRLSRAGATRAPASGGDGSQSQGENINQNYNVGSSFTRDFFNR